MILPNIKLKELVDRGFVTDVGIANQLYTEGKFVAPGTPLTISGIVSNQYDFNIVINGEVAPVDIVGNKFNIKLNYSPSSMIINSLGYGVEDNPNLLAFDGITIPPPIGGIDIGEPETPVEPAEEEIESNSILTIDSICDTGNLTSMYGLFSYNDELTSVCTQLMDTSQCTDMCYMFKDCSSLTTLDLSGWDVSKVEDMSYMFDGCSSLVSLDLSGWNISNNTTMSYMFNYCSSLNEIVVIGCSSATKTLIKNTASASIGNFYEYEGKLFLQNYG